jgi:hypothetical protein
MKELYELEYKIELKKKLQRKEKHDIRKDKMILLLYNYFH